jgi:hypothetical protein
MITQPMPSVSRADVERVVRREFPPDRQAEVLTVLDEYGHDSWNHTPDRVHLAALKLAAGSIEVLRARIEDARYDHRDVIGAAEYPGYMKRGSRIQRLSPDEQKRIVDADWRQYQEWLARG